MPFDLGKIERASFRPVTKEVPVPGLKDLWEGDGEPVLVVRGLDGVELAKVREDAASADSLGPLVQALVDTGKLTQEVEAAIKAVAKAAPKVPRDTIRAYGYLEAGIVEPKLTRAQIIKLYKARPKDMTQVDNEIILLTGDGWGLGE